MKIHDQLKNIPQAKINTKHTTGNIQYKILQKSHTHIYIHPNYKKTTTNTPTNKKQKQITITKNNQITEMQKHTTHLL